MTRRTRVHGDRGTSDALGLALLAPAAIGLALVILFLSRQVDSRATAQSAAEAAAQAAAQERTPTEAVAAAKAVGLSMLVDELTCSSPSIVVDTSAFLAAVDPFVSVAVSCSPSASGLEAIDPPNVVAQTYVAFATIDPFRGTET
jgi:Flp pilus assembly protein TadG